MPPKYDKKHLQNMHLECRIYNIEFVFLSLFCCIFLQHINWIYQLYYSDKNLLIYYKKQQLPIKYQLISNLYIGNKNFVLQMFLWQS